MPPKRIVIKPIIINNTKKMVIQHPNSGMFLKLNKHVFKEDVIYYSENCDFLKGESQKVRIVNKVNLLNKTCRTIAVCTSKGVSVQTTSDAVCALIGQKNYDTILSALGSVFNEETKVRGILALLTTQTTNKTVSTETDEIKRNDKTVQTMETQHDVFIKEKQRKRIRRQKCAPYIVKEHLAKVKKCIINIDSIKKEVKKETKPDLPDLKTTLDDDSNMSIGSMGSLSSLRSVPGVDLLLNSQGLLKDIDIHTEKLVNSTVITLTDGTNIMIPVKPEDVFHIAIPEVLRNVTKEEGMKLIRHQADIDFKLCLDQDDDGYYPLHVAVLHNDVDLVRRQCLALRFRRESVDIPAAGLTALHMAIRQNSPACTHVLLQNGADPLHNDGERRTALHLCAESAAAPLRKVLEYCDAHARQILKNNGDLWKPELESKSDDQLASYLYDQVIEMFNDQGYNPLMLAASNGLAEHVAALAARARRVDAPARGCGSSALYLAVAAVCRQAKDSGNRTSVPENYLKTIEILVEHGADPTIENNSGSSVNALLTDFNICALSVTIANKMTAIKHGNLASNTILYKDKEGRIGYKNIHGMKEINAADVKPVCVERDTGKYANQLKNVKTIPGLKAIIAIDLNEKVKANKLINFNKSWQSNVKNISLKVENTEAVNNKNVSLNVMTDKITGLKVIKADQKIPLDDKTDRRTDKVVIVEDVKLKREFPKVAIPCGSILRSKDLLLDTSVKITNVKVPISNIPRSFKIEPKILKGVSTAKKRKIEKTMK